MAQPGRRSMVGALILIAIGALFLCANLRPGVDAWGVLSRYWPLILVFIGLGKIWDYYQARNAGITGARAWINGPEVAILILVIVCALAVSRGFGRGKLEHESVGVDRQGAQKLTMRVECPPGILRSRAEPRNSCRPISIISSAKASPRSPTTPPEPTVFSPSRRTSMKLTFTAPRRTIGSCA